MSGATWLHIGHFSSASKNTVVYNTNKWSTYFLFQQLIKLKLSSHLWFCCCVQPEQCIFPHCQLMGKEKRKNFIEVLLPFWVILQDNLCRPAAPVNNWRTLLERSFTARMPLLMTTSAFKLGRRCQSSLLQRCYPYCLHILMTNPTGTEKNLIHDPTSRLTSVVVLFAG